MTYARVEDVNRGGGLAGELWRVAELVPTAVAHRVVTAEDGIAVRTACGWEPSLRGHLIGRGQMLRLCRFVCVGCAQTVGVR